MDGLMSYPLNDRGRAYLEARGLGDVAGSLRFGSVPASPSDEHRSYAGRLVIPSIGPRGNVYDVALRCLEDHVCSETVLWTTPDDKKVTCKKYLFLPGMQKRAYNLQALATADRVIDITEGQLDAAALVACGLHAIGFPGSDSWAKHHHRLFGGYELVRVWPDGDEAGSKFAQRVAGDLPNADVMMVPSGEDVNSILVNQGKDAILKIAEGNVEDDEPPF